MKYRRSIRLCVEQLEGRVVPAAIAAPPTPPAPYALWGSTNWAGMDLDTTKGAVTSVSASWVVPAVTGSGTGYSSTWVGIDGDLSSTVEQIGTESDTAATAKRDGTPQYYAWFEMYPAGSHFTTPNTVKPGDQITASVVYAGQQKVGSKTNDTFTLTITDATQNWTFSTTQSVPNHQIAQRTSAEWIQEAPSGPGVLPLANFGSVTFTNAQATIGGATGTIASFVGNPAIINYGSAATPLELNILDMGTFNRPGQWTSIKAETSLLNAAGNSFTVQFGASNPAPPKSSPRVAGPNDGMTDVEDIISTLHPTSVSGPGFTAAALSPSLPDSASHIPFLAGDTRQSEHTLGLPNIAAIQATTLLFADGTAVAALGVSTDVVFETGPGFGVAVGPSLLSTSPPKFAPLAGGAIGGTLPTAMGSSSRETLPMHPVVPQGTDLRNTAGQLPQYAVEGPVDRSAAALVFLTVALHGWNQAANTSDDITKTRRLVKRRLPVHPA